MQSTKETIDYIGSKIKYYRLLNKISLSKLAKEANISKSTLFGLEEGKSNPTISTLINIASTLNISLNELIGDSSNKSSHTNLKLLSVVDENNYKLYQLELFANELFELKDIKLNNLKIEVLKGGVNLIDNSITLFAKDSINLKYNRLFKALNSGALLTIKAYKLNEPYYIKEDIFYKDANAKIVEELINSQKEHLISRVVFNTIKPIAKFNLPKYIEYCEFIINKESHYYIFKRYLGLLGGVEALFNRLDLPLNREYQLLKESITSKDLDKKDRLYIKSNPLKKTKEIVVNSIKRVYKDIIVIEKIEDLYKIEPKKSQKIFLLLELTTQNSNLKNLNLTINLYRALEALYLEDKILNTIESKVYNSIIKSLLEALLFSYYNYTFFAIDTLRELISTTKGLNLYNYDSKLLDNYKYIINLTKEALFNFENNTLLLNMDNLELLLRDLNYIVELKELIAPSINKNGLYAYIIRAKEASN